MKRKDNNVIKAIDSRFWKCQVSGSKLYVRTNLKLDLSNSNKYHENIGGILKCGTFMEACSIGRLVGGDNSSPLNNKVRWAFQMRLIS